MIKKTASFLEDLLYYRQWDATIYGGQMWVETTSFVLWSCYIITDDTVTRIRGQIRVNNHIGN